MDKREIRERVIGAVDQWRDVEAKQRGSIGNLDGGVRPAHDAGGVAGFDSYSGIAATTQLGHDLGLDLEEDNIFLTPSGAEARRVDQVVDILYNAVNRQQGVARAG